jgi:hypothetical protein
MCKFLGGLRKGATDISFAEFRTIGGFQGDKVKEWMERAG